MEKYPRVISVNPNCVLFDEAAREFGYKNGRTLYQEMSTCHVSKDRLATAYWFAPTSEWIIRSPDDLLVPTGKISLMVPIIHGGWWYTISMEAFINRNTKYFYINQSK